jgi:8-hydroxy-5-deazaflavin:NADPH oxidoreductase
MRRRCRTTQTTGEHIMNIVVIGTGNMASAFVRQLARANHVVRIVGRDAAKANALAQAHAGAQVATANAAAEADVIITATGYGDAVSALSALGDLSGKVVIDITNPLTADYMGLTIGHTSSAAEEIARALPGARVVKAFNTVFAQVLGEGGNFGSGHKVPVFVASDDTQAKEAVTALARSMGFDTQDAGALKNARYLEPLGGLNVYFGYGAGLGTSIAPTWLRK